MPRKPDLPKQRLVAVARRMCADRADVNVSRAADGVATQMYRVEHRGSTFYLRVADTSGEDLSVDADILARARTAGAKVPDVVAVESFAPELERSVLLIRAISGAPLSNITEPAVARRVAR